MQIKPKKSLGQNFLIDENILKKICDAGDVDKTNSIVEIGPGTGNLTKYLIKKNPKNIFLVEKDKYFCEILNNEFKSKVKIINDDILKIQNKIINIDNLIVFGNLPYNISTKILISLIKNIEDKNLQKMILMFQKEVADRIIAKTNSKEYGRLSVIAQWKMHIEKMTDISPECFFPKPKVKSTVLIFKPIKNYFKIKNIKNLEHITNVFFNARRKMVKKPLKQLFKNYHNISKKLNIDPNCRPQTLSPKRFFEICNEYELLF